VIGDATLFTVMTAVAKQPEDIVYVIVAVPEDTPVTEPIPAPTLITVAIPVALLLQAPPDASVNSTDDPMHTLAGPAMGDNALTAIVFVTEQEPNE